MIDTGANQSFIDPEAVKKYFSHIPLNLDPFEVTNVHATSFNNYSITIPNFHEFNHNCNIKLFIYKFHNFFDGLIGLDLLDGHEIDLKRNLLHTKNCILPLRTYDSKTINTHEIIPARSSRLINVPINSSNGDIIVTEQVTGNYIIHECITSVIDHAALIEVENPSNNDVIINFSIPFHMKIFNIECTPIKAKLDREQEVISRLRTNHLNEEEKINLEMLCAKYADVFYIEGEKLTFTNHIKHNIRTSDEIPVFTKSYRYPYVHRQEIREQITKMLEQGIIQPSDSAWSSPIWVVPKKVDASGKQKWRLVVDL